jgi:allantoicase
VEVDTAHFKGNYPDRVSLEAASFGAEETPAYDDPRWQPLLSESKLYADSQHAFEELQDLGNVSHVRMCIYPDGGISRIRLFGHAEKPS